MLKQVHNIGVIMARKQMLKSITCQAQWQYIIPQGGNVADNLCLHIENCCCSKKGGLFEFYSMLNKADMSRLTHGELKDVLLVEPLG